MKVDWQDTVGVQEVGEKDPDTPDGNPEAESDTVCAVPADLMTLIVLVPLTIEPDLVMLIGPEAESA